MSREDYEALVQVLHRRLHNTRDPELQALLWQLAEYTDQVTASWIGANRFLTDLTAALNAFYRNTPEE